MGNKEVYEHGSGGIGIDAPSRPLQPRHYFAGVARKGRAGRSYPDRPTELLPKVRKILDSTDIKPPTLAKYLGEFRRQKDKQKAKRQDTPPPRSITAKAAAIAQRAAQNEDTRSSFIVQDTPLDEL